MRETNLPHCRTNWTWAHEDCRQPCWLYHEYYKWRESVQTIRADAYCHDPSSQEGQVFVQSNCGTNDSLWDAATVVNQDEICERFTVNACHNHWAGRTNMHQLALSIFSAIVWFSSKSLSQALYSIASSPTCTLHTCTNRNSSLIFMYVVCTHVMQHSIYLDILSLLQISCYLIKISNYKVLDILLHF